MNTLVLFETISEQLHFYEQGTFEKFKDIFFKGLKFINANVESQDFAAYIYFDFLISIGFIETVHSENSIRWFVNEDHFSHEINKRIYSIDVSSKTNREVPIFSTSFEIFPLFSEVNLEKSQTQEFLAHLSEFELSFQQFKKENISHLGKFIDKYRFIKFYDPILNDWSQVQNCSIDGFYRVGPKIYDMNFLAKINDDFFHIKNLEWAFILAQSATNQGIYNRRLVKFDTIIVPWKFKIPTLMKRVLLACSSKVHYGRIGIEYTVAKRDELYIFLNHLEFYKRAA